MKMSRKGLEYRKGREKCPNYIIISKTKHNKKNLP